MSIGGFNGSDPTPTLAQFKADVAAGKIHYFIAGGGGTGGGGIERRWRRHRWWHDDINGKRHHRLGEGPFHGHHGRRRHHLQPLVVHLDQRVAVSPVRTDDRQPSQSGHSQDAGRRQTTVIDGQQRNRGSENG